MAGVVLALILCVVLGEAVGQYVYISQKKTWSEAQTYCRKEHTDLAYIENANSSKLLLESSEDIAPHGGWIGLYRDPSNSSVWRWSGAGLMTYSNWEPGSPNNYNGIENRGHVKENGTWNDLPESNQLPFYCINAPVVKIASTWEQALENCRSYSGNLAGPMSPEDTQWALDQMRNDGFDLAWTGLRFLGDRWMWVSGESVDPPSLKEVQECPVRDRCGAVDKEGRLQSRDCEDELFFICEYVIN